MIAAMVLGPLIAVRITRHLDDRREIRQRKLQIFKTLMATRAFSYTLSWQHVEALNRIDLEFDKRKKDERAVLDAWKAYLNLLSDRDFPKEQMPIKRTELLVDLLQKMATVLKYEFDSTHIKTAFYAPQAHGDMDKQNADIRQGLIEVLGGKRPLPICVQQQTPHDDKASAESNESH